MYAIIEAGGKQFKVMAGDVIKVEKIDAEIGSKVDYQALFVSDENGNIQTLDNAKKVKVTAEVVAQGKNPKIIVFKYRPKKRTKSKNGHRQPYTEIKILEIK
ncbi:MAG: 50S ribosomal protein L21 [Clostridia bacterium]|nr:50S ribosomal protein L21 [Clostridia bacterium]